MLAEGRPLCRCVGKVRDRPLSACTVSTALLLAASLQNFVVYQLGSQGLMASHPHGPPVGRYPCSSGQTAEQQCFHLANRSAFATTEATIRALFVLLIGERPKVWMKVCSGGEFNWCRDFADISRTCATSARAQRQSAPA